MKKILSALAVGGFVLALAGPAAANPNVDAREAACAALGGDYDNAGTSSHNDATCTVTTIEVVTTTQQVNNAKAAKQVLRTTTTEVTYQTVYAYTGPRDIGAGADGQAIYGDSEMVQCTPGSGYEACPSS